MKKKFGQKTNMLLLFILGWACLLGGAGAAFIRSSVDLISILLLGMGAGGLCMVLGILFKRNKNRLKGHSFKNSLQSALLIVLLCLALVSVNYLSVKYDLRFDVTKHKQHTLTDYSNELLEQLPQEIKITALYVGMPPKYLEDLLKEYERKAAGKISYEIIDPLVNIGYAAQFGNVISGKDQKVIVQSGNERQDINFTENPLNEELLNNAIVRVTRKARNVYFLTGHGEFNIYEEGDAGLMTFARMLMANNILPQKLMLGIKGEIPEDCDVLVIAGAKDNLNDEERGIIDKYLKKGGDALILVEHVVVTTPDKPLTDEEKKKNPSLNEILINWGVKVNDDIVVDLASHASGDVGSPATRNYLSMRKVVKNIDYTFYVRPRSISMVPGRRKTLKAAPFILTASDEKSWGETNRYLDVKYDEALDKPGPVPIGYVIHEPKEEHESSDTRIVLITDADFLTNVYIGSYSNAEMGLSLVNWLSELDYQVLASKKEVEIEELNLTSRQKRVVLFILFLIPVCVLLSGVAVWVRRLD